MAASTVGIGAPSATEVVGRHAELAALEEVVNAGARAPAFAVLEGEAGIGKTVLLDAAVAEAGRQGFRILSARPAESEAQFAFVGLGDLLGETAPEVLSSLPAPQQRALAAALMLEEPT